jgi:ATP-dependent Clp protease protease subunit
MFLSTIQDGEGSLDIYSKMLKEGSIFVQGTIDNPSATKTVAELLYLNSVDPNKEIKLYINSYGGEIDSGMAIIDTMNLISNPVSTICMGLAASMGAWILANGEKGLRKVLPNSRVMIHQPLGDAKGQASDIEIGAEQIIKMKKRSIKNLAERTGKSEKEITKDIERDKWLNAEESLKYGIVDNIVEKQSKGE